MFERRFDSEGFVSRDSDVFEKGFHRVKDTIGFFSLPLFQIGEFVKSGLTVFFSTIREMDTIDRITKIEKFCIIILLVIN